MKIKSTKYTQLIVMGKGSHTPAETYFQVQSINELSLGDVKFQDGAIPAHGINGVMNEDLLHMVRIRLESFQKSQFKCRENALAITKIEEALHWLGHRTKAREDRGVEGTSEP